MGWLIAGLCGVGWIAAMVLGYSLCVVAGRADEHMDKR